ncbi:MAG: prepilin-type N-terminal cleavage/methylation domain-containing protein [Planctomycetota bacterium]|jgi:prepilin-type N-terminal cleavage/methylation domain-containing protein/prepilin-type processing-associated H-X9-DG protein
MKRTSEKHTRIGGHSQRGFTLTELLVVVSIIALMITITLPALTRAQRNGEGIHCLANEHQLMLAWLQYSVDSDDQLCDPNALRFRLRRYVPTDEVYVCKTVQDENATSSYGISNTMGGDGRDAVTPYEKLHHISQPSRRMVLVDVDGESQTCFWPLLRYEETWKWRPWSWPPSTNLQNMTARHNDGCNMSFADGHGEHRRWKDRRTVKLIKGLIVEPNLVSHDNVDLEFAIDVLTN